MLGRWTQLRYALAQSVGGLGLPALGDLANPGQPLLGSRGGAGHGRARTTPIATGRPHIQRAPGAGLARPGSVPGS